MFSLQLRYSECACKDYLQFIDADRLAEKIVGALADRLHPILFFILAGYHHNLKRWVGVKEIAQCRKSLARISWRRRQSKVESHDSGSVLLQILKCTLPVLGQ